MTSHDVVSRLRRILKIRQIGHSGTLDPQASGVLFVFVGKATKCLQFLEDTDKEYIAGLQLGISTTTEDIWGDITEQVEVSEQPDFSELIPKFIGKQKQLPPMVSSIKVNGKKLYEYARAGIEVERPLRDVEVYSFEEVSKSDLTFKIACSSGTYVRSLLRDLCISAGTIGCMNSLVRTRVGRFTLDDCVSLKDVEEGNYQLHDILEVLDHFEQHTFTPMKTVIDGKPIAVESDKDSILIVEDHQAMAVMERRDDGLYYMKRGLW